MAAAELHHLGAGGELQAAKLQVGEADQGVVADTRQCRGRTRGSSQ